MRVSHCLTALAFCLVLGGSTLASQDAQAQNAPAKPLTNADVLDMLKAGLSQEIVIAKINTSTCEFDTSPAALKGLKAANIPDVVILAMVQRQSGPTPPRSQEAANTEVSRHARVECATSHADPVPVFSGPRTQQALNQSLTDSVEVFKVKCADRITILGDDKQSWLKMRSADGQVGYISSAVVSMQPSAEEKRKQIQRVNDDLEDCRVRAQNEYETKTNAIGTLALPPMTRVYAASKLKQNLDAELRTCRSQYESRLKAIEAEE